MTTDTKLNIWLFLKGPTVPSPHVQINRYIRLERWISKESQVLLLQILIRTRIEQNRVWLGHNLNQTPFPRTTNEKVKNSSNSFLSQLPFATRWNTYLLLDPSFLLTLPFEWSLYVISHHWHTVKRFRIAKKLTKSQDNLGVFKTMWSKRWLLITVHLSRVPYNWPAK